ncbi:hypothetical protein BVI434_850021 [Burkholderia vietnamiensis]|nr:hypothetical protein BVI434_850021 [Burkholderia vietnamiensis]
MHKKASAVSFFGTREGLDSPESPREAAKIGFLLCLFLAKVRFFGSGHWGTVPIHRCYR